MGLTLQWLAGFFDGEGYIGFYSNQQGNLYPRITITNTYLPVLKAIQAQFGGSLCITRRSDKSKGIHQCYTLCWWSKQAIPLLKELVPFLTVKKSQAELIIQGYETLKRDGRKLSQAVKDGRAQLRSQITEQKEIEYLQ